MKTWRRKIENGTQIKWAVDNKWPCIIRNDFENRGVLELSEQPDGMYIYFNNGKDNPKMLGAQDFYGDSTFLVPKTVEELVEGDRVNLDGWNDFLLTKTMLDGDYPPNWPDMVFIPALPEDIFGNQEEV